MPKKYLGEIIKICRLKRRSVSTAGWAWVQTVRDQGKEAWATTAKKLQVLILFTRWRCCRSALVV